MNQFEIKANSRAEFDRVLDHMKRIGMRIQDTYEPNFRILATLSKKQRLDLEGRGVNIRGMRDRFYGNTEAM